MAYYAPEIDPNNFWIFSFFGLMYPISLFVNVAFIIFWAFRELKFSLISLLAIALGWGNVSKYLAYNTDKVSNRQHDVSIISFNIGNAIEAYDKKAEAKETKLIKMNHFLDRFKDEDIICLQEVGSYAEDIIKKNFKNYNIHKYDKGAVIISKHKIINKGQIDFGTKTNSCLWSDIVIDLDTFRVYSLHLQSNNISVDAKNMIENGSLKEEKTWKGVKGIFRKYRYYHKTRAVQSKLVKNHANNSPYPVVLCGDFNDVPLSYTYEHLSEGLNDCYVQKGNGLGSTFNGKIPFLRIDYILLDKNIDVRNFNTIRENYSDHYPVAALISLKKV
jgi:endonuclease/exonuclease/phosphatase family metal-dependent hydrolase